MEQGAGIYGYGNFMKGVDTVKMHKGSMIKGHLNKFKSFYSLEMQSRSVIGSKNVFFGTFHKLSPFKKHELIRLGEQSNITSGHLFDLSDEIRIGNNVTFGGNGSQLWTHGFDLENTKIQAPIVIGNNCYIGTRVLMMPGNSICDHVSVGAGTIIAKSIKESGFYVSSNLIKKSDIPSYKHNDGTIVVEGNNFYRKEI